MSLLERVHVHWHLAGFGVGDGVEDGCVGLQLDLVDLHERQVIRGRGEGALIRDVFENLGAEDMVERRGAASLVEQGLLVVAVCPGDRPVPRVQGAGAEAEVCAAVEHVQVERVVGRQGHAQVADVALDETGLVGVHGVVFCLGAPLEWFRDVCFAVEMGAQRRLVGDGFVS